MAFPALGKPNFYMLKRGKLQLSEPKQTPQARLPKLTDEERRQALEKAQRLRKERAEIRRQLKEGELALSMLLAQTPNEVTGRMKISHLLQSLPSVGKKISAKIMEEIGIADSKRLEGLSPRQHQELVAFAKRFEARKNAGGR